MNWDPIFITLKLAVITTILLFVIAVPIAFWLAKTKSIFKPIVEAIISLPLVLPPTVLGFYFLIVFSPNNVFSQFIAETFGVSLVFSFTGLVIGSVIYSLPFMVQPIHAGFKSLPDSFVEASYLLGKSKLKTLTKVQLPNIKQSLLTAIILTFAHTVGEFGIVLMIGGNIPSETKVVSIAIYDEVESLNYSDAHLYSGILLGFAFIVLLVVYSSKDKIFTVFK